MFIFCDSCTYELFLSINLNILMTSKKINNNYDICAVFCPTNNNIHCKKKLSCY